MFEELFQILSFLTSREGLQYSPPVIRSEWIPRRVEVALVAIDPLVDQSIGWAIVVWVSLLQRLNELVTNRLYFIAVVLGRG